MSNAYKIRMLLRRNRVVEFLLDAGCQEIATKHSRKFSAFRAPWGVVFWVGVGGGHLRVSKGCAKLSPYTGRVITKTLFKMSTDI
jgi:hypothetical protein